MTSQQPPAGRQWFRLASQARMEAAAAAAAAAPPRSTTPPVPRVPIPRPQQQPSPPAAPPPLRTPTPPLALPSQIQRVPGSTDTRQQELQLQTLAAEPPLPPLALPPPPPPQPRLPAATPPESPKVIRTSSSTPPPSPRAKVPEPEPESKTLPQVQPTPITVPEMEKADGKEITGKVNGSIKTITVPEEDKTGSNRGTAGSVTGGLSPAVGKIKEEGEMRIITIAGENTGAIMDFGSAARHLNNRLLTGAKLQEGGNEHKPKVEPGNGKLEKEKEGKSCKPRAAVVNSNVQSINNSIVLNSSCVQQSPGVHITFASRRHSSGGVGFSGDKDHAHHLH